MYQVDYQVHSFRSHDGKASILEHCARAAEIGLREICFTEHKDFDPADPAVDYFDYRAYMEEIERARAGWPQLAIRAGVEIDYQVEFEPAIRDYLAARQFDFVLGSVHYVDRVMIMTPEYNAGRTRESAYSDYFHAVLQSVRSGLFDAVAHLEYANRRGISAWGAYEAGRYVDCLQPVFHEMVERCVALELNTAGLHQAIGLTYPCEATLRLYRECGGAALSIGSDAHHPDQLAHAFAVAADLAIRNGFPSVSVWSERRWSEQSLDVQG